MEKMVLSEPHCRGIASALWYTEKVLAELEAVLMSQPSLATLYCFENDLTSAQKERISDSIYSVRQIIASVAARLSLKRDAMPLSQMIRATASSVRVALEETQPQSLTRYGPVPKKISQELGPALEALIAQVDRIDAAAAK